MSRPTKVENILKDASEIADRKLARDLRLATLNSIIKTSQDYGILQHPAGHEVNYHTRDQFVAQRGGTRSEKLYGVGPEHEKANLSVDYVSRSLSTRYSPDRVGVQARRISDGVYQDPITNKKYDWNEGFTTDDGSKFSGGSVDLQTDIMYFE